MLDPITKTDTDSSHDVLNSYSLTFRLDFLSPRFSFKETEEVVKLIEKSLRKRRLTKMQINALR